MDICQEEKEKICCICLDEKIDFVSLNCGSKIKHTMCTDCFKVYKPMICHICRQQIKIDTQNEYDLKNILINGLTNIRERELTFQVMIDYQIQNNVCRNTYVIDNRVYPYDIINRFESYNIEKIITYIYLSRSI